MCGKCVQTHAPKVKSRKKRLSSAKPTEGMSSVQPTAYTCPVQEFGYYAQVFIDEDEDVTENQVTRRVPSDANYDDVRFSVIRKDEAASESSATENADALSKKIQDSIEFTSQTCTARNRVNFREMNDVE